ncbi:unnamed protein product [Sphenostylis stenocarpa]|uniref:Uncharacterized protein n=1 Tax=Sphenostylis stenocarpa TaxID=92480 RepID=A0AA86VLA8_9FABA|nr:unnamed protein product [Sphenostylis stenocarpa]
MHFFPFEQQRTELSGVCVDRPTNKRRKSKRDLPKLVKDVAADGDRLEVLANRVERLVADRANGARKMAAVHHPVRLVGKGKESGRLARGGRTGLQKIWGKLMLMVNGEGEVEVRNDRVR